MILAPDCGPRKTPAPDFTNIPAELAALNTWACWRARKKANQRVHPVSGAEPRGSHPEEWASFKAVRHPRLRKPVDGIGVYLAQDSGLAVVFKADSTLPARLGDQVVYAERSVSGDGLTVVVRAGVLGAVVNRFVPLSGQPPYQGEAGEVSAACLDSVWTRAVPGKRPVWTRAVPGNCPLSGKAPYPGLLVP